MLMFAYSTDFIASYSWNFRYDLRCKIAFGFIILYKPTQNSSLEDKLCTL
jgi:hypothetical protein